MPPVDETMPQDGRLSDGPHSDTAWVNMLGVPAISIPAGFYPSGLPFGIEISTRKWHDGDMISWAYDYELQTKTCHLTLSIAKGKDLQFNSKPRRRRTRVPRNSPAPNPPPKTQQKLSS
jgi:Asp-tRNA(Asn)/Glu-tRNA(Gln) amidotransferase A subunit family amidase